MPRAKTKRPTIYDLAEAAGVSIGTVSRALNTRREVAAETRAKVLEAARRIKFMPKLTTRRMSIGLVVREIEEVHEVGYVGAMLSELANHSARCGAVLEVVPLNDIERVYTHYLQGLIGLLFGEAAQKLKGIKHIPVWLINNLSERDLFNTVATDHAEGARMGAEYLLRRGHRRIALVQIEKSDWGARERERGFRQAFKAVGVPVPTDLITYLESWSIEKAFDPVLKRGPTAVFVSGEDLSIAVTEALVRRLRVRIPEDLSLLTFEVPLLSRMFDPPHTTIAQPWIKMARTAMDGVLGMVGKPAGELQHVTLPNRLIERDSVADCR